MQKKRGMSDKSSSGGIYGGIYTYVGVRVHGRTACGAQNPTRVADKGRKNDAASHLYVRSEDD